MTTISAICPDITEEALHSAYLQVLQEGNCQYDTRNVTSAKKKVKLCMVYNNPPAVLSEINN